jgi:hypothetical protein
MASGHLPRRAAWGLLPCLRTSVMVDRDNAPATSNGTMPLRMRCLRSRRVMCLLITPVLIAGAMLAMSRASAANASLGERMWDDDPGMKLEMRPPVAPTSLHAQRSTASPLPAPVALPTPAARSAPATPMAHGNPLWAVPLRVLHNTRERPLFSSSRRPPPDRAAPPSVAAAPPPPPAAAKASRPDLRLVGTIVGDHERIGVFVEDGTAKMLRLRTGEGHEGWILRHVEVRRVTLDNATTRAVLTLPVPGSDPQHEIPSPYARGTRRVHH